MVKIDRRSALIVVDVQNDFCPGGALPVAAGDRIIPVLNRYIARFQRKRAHIVATRDWHPPSHISFKDRGGPWPPHCVQGTPGAAYHPKLRLPRATFIVSKADRPDREAYSGFEETALAVQLRKWQVRWVFVGGLATDYCVKNTVLDALQAGFETYLLTDASRGVELRPGDSERAVQEMLGRGAKPVALAQIR